MSSEDGPPSSATEPQLTFNVKASNDAKYILTLPASTTVADLKAKLSTSEYADVPVDRLRLIYSGRVLKDADTLESYKIKDGHTIHLVKGAASNARQNPANQGSSSSAGTTPAPAANVPTNMAAGTGNNPLSALTGARYAGFHGLPNAAAFGADGGVSDPSPETSRRSCRSFRNSSLNAPPSNVVYWDRRLFQNDFIANGVLQMGAPPNPDEMMRMLEDPNFLQQMNEAMNNPAFQQMIEQSPMLRDNPMARQLLRDPNFRRLMFDPNMMRMQLQMQRSLGGGGPGGNFPAPGVTDTTPQTGGEQQGQNATATGTAANPFGNLLGGMPPGDAQGNPFAALFGGMPPQTTGTTGTSSPPVPADGTQTNTQNPANALAQLMEAMNALNQFAPQTPTGGAGTSPGTEGGQEGNTAAAQNPFAALFNPWGTPSQPADNRPPEERYAEQLRQLNDMGFYEFERNVQALRRSGGSVQGAVEYLLSGGDAGH